MFRRDKAINSAKNIYRLMNDPAVSSGEKATAEHKLNQMFRKYGFGYEDLREPEEQTYRYEPPKRKQRRDDYVDITNKKPNWKQSVVNRIFGLDNDDSYDTDYVSNVAPGMSKEDLDGRVFHGHGSGTPNKENVRSRRYFSTNDDLKY